MSNVIPLQSETPNTGRELVAAEVRAELARQRQNSNSLPKHLGKSQRYWYERINAKLPFSVDDLAALSTLLQVPMSRFVPPVIAPTPHGDDTEIASNPRTLVPKVAGSIPVGGTIIPFARRHRPTIEHATAAPVTSITGERIA